MREKSRFIRYVISWKVKNTGLILHTITLIIRFINCTSIIVLVWDDDILLLPWRSMHVHRDSSEMHIVIVRDFYCSIIVQNGHWLMISLEHFLFFHIFGMSWSQLTNSYFSEGLKPPSSNMFHSNILNTFVDHSHVAYMSKYVTYKSTILRVSMMLSQRMNPRNPNDLPEMAVVSPFPRWNMVKPEVQVVRSCLLKVFSVFFCMLTYFKHKRIADEQHLVEKVYQLVVNTVKDHLELENMMCDFLSVYLVGGFKHFLNFP